jgi:hypothetical protein
MSIHIIALEAGGNRILAIADKRIGKGRSLNGELLNWEHVHDNALKLKRITDTLYSASGTLEDMSEDFYNQLLLVRDKKPSEILKLAETIDREIRPAFWNKTHNQAIIFGAHDDGRLFIWTGKGDGTTELFFGSDKSTLDYSGGLGDTADRAVHALAMSLKRGNNLPKAMVDAVHFAASIDKVISPTFDFVEICKDKTQQSEERLLMTDVSGRKRVQINADNNNIQVINSADQVLIEADDDSAIEGSYWNRTPPLVLQPGNVYPKNYLGEFNDATGQMRYYYATMGPGISVGVSPAGSNGFSTLGRKQIYTNGKVTVSNADESQKTEINKTGITTTGNITAGGNLDVAGDFKVSGNLTVNGSTGFTGYELVSSSGPQTRKYIKGVYMGIGPNGSW